MSFFMVELEAGVGAAVPEEQKALLGRCIQAEEEEREPLALETPLHQDTSEGRAARE